MDLTLLSLSIKVLEFESFTPIAAPRYECVCVCVCVCVCCMHQCVSACVLACVRACERACVRACVLYALSLEYVCIILKNCKRLRPVRVRRSKELTL